MPARSTRSVTAISTATPADRGVGDEVLRAVQHPVSPSRTAVVRVPPDPSRPPPRSAPRRPAILRRPAGARTCGAAPPCRTGRCGSSPSDVVGRERQRDRPSTRGHLFDDRRVVAGREAGAAVLLGKDHAQKAELARACGTPRAETPAPRPTRGRAAGSPLRRTREASRRMAWRSEETEVLTRRILIAADPLEADVPKSRCPKSIPLVRSRTGLRRGTQALGPGT